MASAQIAMPEDKVIVGMYKQSDRVARVAKIAAFVAAERAEEDAKAVSASTPYWRACDANRSAILREKEASDAWEIVRKAIETAKQKDAIAVEARAHAAELARRAFL